VLHNVEEPSAVYRKDDILKRHPTVPLELCILLLIPAECFHDATLHHDVPFVISLWRGRSGSKMAQKRWAFLPRISLVRWNAHSVLV
jgi:hypothetical protein